MKPLDPKSRSLIDQVWAEDLPPPELEDAILRSLSAKLPQPLPPTAAAAQHALSSGAGIPLASSAALKLVIGVIAVSVAATAAIHYSASPSAAGKATTPEAHALQPLAAGKKTPQPAAESGSAPSRAVPPAAADGVASSQLKAAPSAAVVPPPRAALSDGEPLLGSLAEETELLARAQRALQSGSPNEALAWIEQHTQRFPQGALAQERDAARVFSLCSLRRKGDARRAQLDFLRDWPTSPLAKRVKIGCRAQ